MCKSYGQSTEPYVGWAVEVIAEACPPPDTGEATEKV